MNPIFELWSPHFDAGGGLVLDVTPANLPELDQPPAEWINGCLSSLGFKPRAVSWRVRASRCNYYSNFPQADDWQDRWRIMWTMDILLDGQERRPSPLSTLPSWFDQHDPSWLYEDEDDHGESGTLLFVTPERETARAAAQVDIVAQDLEKLGRQIIKKSTHAYDDGWIEGRICFSRAALGSDAAPLDAIVARLRDAGFVTNWNDLMSAKSGSASPGRAPPPPVTEASPDPKSAVHEMKASTLWSDAARARRFIIPDAAEVPPGAFVLRTSLGRERAVDEAAVLPFEVTAEEAQAWAKAQLGGVLGEVRGKAVGFVERLRERTAALREENRRTWEQGVADAPEEVRQAVGQVMDGLRDLGEALRRAARDPAAPPGQPGAGPSDPAGTAEAGPAAPHAADSSGNTSNADESASPRSVDPSTGAA